MNEADSPSAINFIRDRLPKVRRFDRLAGPVGASFVLCVPTEFDSTLVTAIGRLATTALASHACPPTCGGLAMKHHCYL